MSLFVNQPLISLTPVATNLYDPVSLLPVSTQIYLDPTNIYYDPFKTYNALFPSYPGIYVSYPDVNADTKMQKDVIHKIWNKLQKWILGYVKIYKFVKGTNGNYEFVTSLTEAENNKINSAELEDKADWILTHFYTKSKLAGTLEKFRTKMNINWWDIEDNLDILKQFIYHQMRRKILEKFA